MANHITNFGELYSAVLAQGSLHVKEPTAETTELIERAFREINPKLRFSPEDQFFPTKVALTTGTFEFAQKLDFDPIKFGRVLIGAVLEIDPEVLHLFNDVFVTMLSQVSYAKFENLEL